MGPPGGRENVAHLSYPPAMISARFNRTKIVVTLGPASWAPDTIRALIEAGADVFRINMSHASTDGARDLIRRIRSISDEVAVLLDTKGPELRTTNVAEPCELVEGETVALVAGQPEALSDAATIYVKHPDLPRYLQEGRRVFMDDGLLRLRVTSISDDGLSARCLVERGGTLTSRRGVNVPGTNPFPPEVTAPDAEAVTMAAQEGVDFLAASFVHDSQCVERFRTLLREGGSPSTAIIAKVETESAVENLAGILEASDGLMVARGDLGVEIPPEEVPLVQKRMVRACNGAGKPVIVATQMLESMIEHPIATRAETSDVANAIIDGTDAIMLSGETAKGRYPIEAVRTMVTISDYVERNADLFRQRLWEAPATTTADFVAKAVCTAVQDLDEVQNVVALTWSGRTARLVSSYKPCADILATTPHPEVARQLALSYGVRPFVVPHGELAADGLRNSLTELCARGLLESSTRIVVTYGVPMSRAGTTNVLSCDRVDVLLGEG